MVRDLTATCDGDLDAAVKSWMGREGLERISPDESKPGDLGFIIGANKTGTFLSRIDQGWIARGPKGFVVLQKAETAWRI